jgi:hypothetical protein
MVASAARLTPGLPNRFLTLLADASLARLLSLALPILYIVLVYDIPYRTTLLYTRSMFYYILIWSLHKMENKQQAKFSLNELLGIGFTLSVLGISMAYGRPSLLLL